MHKLCISERVQDAQVRLEVALQAVSGWSLRVSSVGILCIYLADRRLTLASGPLRARLALRVNRAR